MTDTRPTSNALTCTYPHHAGTLHCAAGMAELPYPWDQYRFTARERDVAGLLALGEPNKVIARRLSLGLPTIKNRVSGILVKTKTSNRTKCALTLVGF